jgi:acyl-CoA synthetase (AMP-forming)/AMP-acid ligase II
MAALARLAVTQSPLLPLYRDREVGYIVKNFRPALLLVPSEWRGYDHLALAQRAIAGLDDPGSCTIVVCDRSLPEGDPSELPSFSEADRAGDEVRWVLFTSGTTADPKGALHTDGTLAAASRGLVERARMTARDQYPVLFPYTHVGGLNSFFAQLMTGSHALIAERFDPEGTIEWLAGFDVTIAAGGTTLIQSFLEYQRRHPEHRLFPNLRCGLAGQAPKPPLLQSEVKNELGGVGVVSCYGLTEAPCTTFTSVDDADDVLSQTEGRAITGVEVRLVGEAGSVCAPGETGEVRIRGVNVCKGYLDPSLNDDAFDESGFFRSGDLGRLDAEGNLVIVGRLKDVIIRKGENIPAKQVEDILYEHPKVLEVAVVGLPDTATGERCCAAIVLRNPDDPLTFEEMSEYCLAQGLARHMVPEQLELVAELPRNATGKVLKRDLRAQILA